jgi:hypothetical protein
MLRIYVDTSASKYTYLRVKLGFNSVYEKVEKFPWETCKYLS